MQWEATYQTGHGHVTTPSIISSVIGLLFEYPPAPDAPSHRWQSFPFLRMLKNYVPVAKRVVQFLEVRVFFELIFFKPF